MNSVWGIGATTFVVAFALVGVLALVAFWVAWGSGPRHIDRSTKVTVDEFGMLVGATQGALRAAVTEVAATECMTWDRRPTGKPPKTALQATVIAWLGKHRSGSMVSNRVVRRALREVQNNMAARALWFSPLARRVMTASRLALGALTLIGIAALISVDDPARRFIVLLTIAYGALTVYLLMATTPRLPRVSKFVRSGAKQWRPQVTGSRRAKAAAMSGYALRKFDRVLARSVYSVFGELNAPSAATVKAKRKQAALSTYACGAIGATGGDSVTAHAGCGASSCGSASGCGSSCGGGCGGGGGD